jgi:3-hydroxyisobutyrate dehydrogenase
MQVSVVGTGAMGSAVAEALLKGGHAVTVQNRTRSKAEPLAALGATVVDTPAQAISASQTSVLVLFDADSIRELISVNATREAIRGRSLLNVAATTPEEVVALAAMVRDLGGNLAEICIAAYPQTVREQQAEILLAADRSHVEQWRLIVAALGPKVHDLGDIGNASRSEMALWLPYMFQTVAVAFGLGAFQRLGLPTAVVHAMLSDNAVLGVAGAASLVPEMLARTYRNPKWTVNNFATSCEMIIGFARTLGLPTTILDAVADLYRRTAGLGLGDRDVSAIYELFAPNGSSRAE